MNNINTKYSRKVFSKHQTSEITSTTTSDIQSKTNMNLVSNVEAAAEKEAFLTTAKHNAAIMFAKYL